MKDTNEAAIGREERQGRLSDGERLNDGRSDRDTGGEGLGGGRGGMWGYRE